MDTVGVQDGSDVQAELRSIARSELNWAEVSRAAQQALIELAQSQPTQHPQLVRWTEDEFEPAFSSTTSRVFAMGGNFAEHMARMTSSHEQPVTARDLLDSRGEESPPWGYLVIPGTLTGHQGTVTPPDGARFLDYEGEFALAVASQGRNLKVQDIEFSGITAFSDFSLRDKFMGHGLPIDRGPLSWALGKNFESGKAMGPWMALGVADDDASVLCRVNGELRQDSSQDSMIYRLAEAVSYLSRFLTIRPGDVIASGCPSGTAADTKAPYLKAGDVVDVEVSGVGTLRNIVGDWDTAHRPWTSDQ